MQSILKEKPTAYDMKGECHPLDMMIAPTTRTPFVKYYVGKRFLLIKGPSTAVDMHHFYSPLISRLKQSMYELDTLTLYLSFNDLNSSTTKVLFDLFSYLKDWSKFGKKVEIIWEVTTPEIMETGKDFAELINIDFSYVSPLAA